MSVDPSASEVPSLAAEKAILRHKQVHAESLDTAIDVLGDGQRPNAVPETKIGRYRPLDSRMCATAEMELIRAYMAQGQEPPSFMEAGPRAKLFFDPHDVRVGIVTPGGIAPGLNTVIHSIVSMHHDIYKMRREVWGFRGGFRGVVSNDVQLLTPKVTREWLQKGGTGLKSGRERPNIPEVVKRLEEIGIGILYVIGGDGSLTAAHRLAQEVKRRELKIAIVGIPKTMDNDILWVWHSFGFNTSVDEATRIINALHDEASSTERVCLLPLFGRDAGFVAAHAALASGQVDVVLVPEVSFRMEPVLEHVRTVIQDKGYAMVVVAEGARPRGLTDEDVEQHLQKLGLDPTDRANPRVNEALRDGRLFYIRSRFEEHFNAFKDGRHRVFVNEPRYQVRAVPATPLDQIYCRRLADLAVHNALAGLTGFMISQWLTEYVLVPLRLVAEGHKSIPAGGIFWTTVISTTGQPAFD